MSKLVAVGAIYIASCCYVMSQYYHLSLHKWSFGKAVAIAIPFVIVEYSFSLHGSKLASQSMNPVQILLMTISFYLINIWILNIFILKSDIQPIRELVAFGLIVTALFISSNTHF